VSPGSTKLVRLTGEGVDTPARLVEFGTPYKNARAILDPALGAPTKDTGEVVSFSDSSSIFGQLTGTGPRDTALLVEAGESCGE
jgi:hypothetical protein